jgi:Zn-dependent peptidase ImmA (M78 family)
VLVYTKNLPKAPISGATRWIHNTPMIQLSGRYKTNDHFWFTFFHEAGHILLHGKKDIFLEEVEGTLLDEKKEDEANRFAEKWLLSIKQKEEIKKQGPSKNNIIYFSKKFQIHPGIIVGQLQHKNILDHSQCNDLKEKIFLFNEKK